MKEYEVEVIETLSRLVPVKAEGRMKAMSIVKDMYDDEEIILDSSDYVKTDFECYELP